MSSTSASINSKETLKVGNVFYPSGLQKSGEIRYDVHRFVSSILRSIFVWSEPEESVSKNPDLQQLAEVYREKISKFFSEDQVQELIKSGYELSELMDFLKAEWFTPSDIQWIENGQIRMQDQETISWIWPRKNSGKVVSYDRFNSRDISIPQKLICIDPTQLDAKLEPYYSINGGQHEVQSPLDRIKPQELPAPLLDTRGKTTKMLQKLKKFLWW